MVSTSMRSGVDSFCMARETSVLFVGDVVGAPTAGARDAAARAARGAGSDVRRGQRRERRGRIGITPKEADALFAMGADAITLGNYTYRHREIWPYLDERREIIRPANYPPGQPGRGTCLVERDGVTLGVVELSGQPLHAGRQPRARDRRRGAARGRGRRSRAGRHARGGDEREGRARLVPRRQGHGRRRHPHARAHRGRARAPGRDGLHHRRRHDGRARRRDRRAPRAVAVMRTHMPMRYDSSDEDPWINALVRASPQRRRAESIEQILRPA